MKYIITVLSLLFIAGCTTLEDAKNSRGSGQIQAYSYPYEMVWSAAVNAVEESKLTLVSKEKSQGSLLAKTGLSALSYGENVAIFVESIDEKKTTVEVISKKAVATTFLAKDWSDEIHLKIRSSLIQ